MAKKDIILVIDQGTTGTKVIGFDTAGDMHARGYAKLPLQFPQSGWVEVSPDAVEKSVRHAIAECLKMVDPKRIACIGITNQRETCTLFDVKHQKALYPFIVWQDRRTREVCQKLPSELLFQKTGLRAHPYFSASKLNWILSTQSVSVGADCRVMTIDTFLIYLLSGHKDIVTDPSNASRTLLYNIHSDAWDDELCSMFDVPEAALPFVVPNGEIASKTASVFGLPAEIPIIAPLGDQQAAWVGSGALFSPTLKLTVGTGSFSIGPVVHDPYARGILQTIGYHAKSEKHFGYEGVAFCSGMITEWLLNSGWIGGYDEIERMPFPPESAVDFFPLFTEIGTPYWKNTLFGASLTQLNLQCSPRDIVLAAIQSIAFQNRLILDQYDLKQIPKLYMDGGVSQYRIVQNMMAALLEKEIWVSSFADMTGFGVCLSILREHLRVDADTLQQKCASHFEILSGESRTHSDVFYRRYESWKRQFDKLAHV